MAEKHFLYAVEYMIKDCCTKRGNLQELKDTLKNQYYFGELQRLASVYPDSSSNYYLLMNNPSSLVKKYKVPLWRKIIRLRWALITPFCRLKNDRELYNVV